MHGLPGWEITIDTGATECFEEHIPLDRDPVIPVLMPPPFLPPPLPLVPPVVPMDALGIPMPAAIDDVVVVNEASSGEIDPNLIDQDWDFDKREKHKSKKAHKGAQGCSTHEASDVTLLLLVLGFLLRGSLPLKMIIR